MIDLFGARLLPPTGFALCTDRHDDADDDDADYMTNGSVGQESSSSETAQWRGHWSAGA